MGLGELSVDSRELVDGGGDSEAGDVSSQQLAVQRVVQDVGLALIPIPAAAHLSVAILLPDGVLLGGVVGREPAVVVGGLEVEEVVGGAGGEVVAGAAEVGGVEPGGGRWGFGRGRGLLLRVNMMMMIGGEYRAQKGGGVVLLLESHFIFSFSFFFFLWLLMMREMVLVLVGVVLKLHSSL
ncbi:hypothetical protein DM860_000438 [Cuscuta australis]|uniref:Uncharacterized protein n=1 Tax=Cuscuta australis TaxID=267555 RepID=A0A328CWX3_9ASTE|nr:hypothetical protein DM860_000438 [Cuscuta australis]